MPKSNQICLKWEKKPHDAQETFKITFLRATI